MQVKTLILAAVLAAPAALAQQIGQEPLGAPAVPPTHAVEQADAKLAQVARERAALEAEFAASEKACYERFFVNNCLDQAKEKRRAGLAAQRAIEVEAQHFKRQHAVDVRDRELEERAKKDAAEAVARAAKPPVKRTAPEDKPLPRPAAVSLEQRQAAHDARIQQLEAQDAAQAGARAANVKKYEKKKADSEKRQADIAAKRAEKAEKLRKRQEAEAEKAAKTQAGAAASQPKQ
ncbi:hypothetical protein [Massilia sp. YIM B04103]|uniref:hypothetical protein n=1 Tax=Massilia sp. YIM B04103 TaxID=2963106 RepID=UPI00210CABA1|nr:hypothetical protein [Massilia sp. YIM B04103]